MSQPIDPFDPVNMAMRALHQGNLNAPAEARCENQAKTIAEMSDNKFQIRTFAAGEIVPALQVADAVQNGTVEAGQTAAYYYFGKDPSFVFETGLPFSMNQRQYTAWLQFGGGNELMQEFYKPYGIKSFLFGGTGCQMGGWFRKEINTVDDLKGLGEAKGCNPPATPTHVKSDIPPAPPKRKGPRFPIR